jgi:DNA polymerase
MSVEPSTFWKNRFGDNDVVLVVHADVESRSRVNLKLVGAHVYWEHPSTECLMMAYRIGVGPLQMWERGQPQPPDLIEAFLDGAVLVAHNAEFERLAFRWLSRNAGWLVPKKYRCTAAMAAAMALPRDLDTLGKVLGLKAQKDAEGSKLIRKFCQPRRDGTWNEPQDFPEDYERFKAYCAQDVRTEEEAESRMLPLSEAEQEIYRLGQVINDRGLRIDRRSAYAALRLAERAKAKFDRQLAQLTGGAVRRSTDAAALHRWINEQGVGVNSAAKADLMELLALDVPSHVKQAVRIRLAAGKTSVSKIKAMLNRASARDDRVRGAFVYHAASTGRFQSFGVNFANLPRPRKAFEKLTRPDLLFRVIRSADPDLMEFLYGPDLGSPMHMLSDAIRSFVWAAPGKKLVVADYSGIEGAIVAWLANEQWKLAAMRDIIANPSLPDMYQRTAAQIVGTSVEAIDKKHPLRQSVGKVSELALGFGGGVGAFASMARNYGVDLDALYDPVYERADDLDIIQAEKRYKECCSRKERTTSALSERAWIACELIKRAWRAANAAIRQFWWDLEEGVRLAVRQPGTVVEVGYLKYIAHGGYLFCRLPSGRCLAYASPKLKAQVYASRLIDGAWAAPEVLDADLADKLEALGKARIERKSFSKVTALGVDSTTRQFTRFGLYGGLLCENPVQAVARDVLVAGMRHAEAAHYPVIGTVYDELICETARNFGSAEELSRLICRLPAWARGLPLTASGYEAKRYRKG